MASSIDVTLTLGYEGRIPDQLHEHITAPVFDGQHLTMVCGRAVSGEDLEGSGQVGTLRIYAGRIRRGDEDLVIDHLRAANWRHIEAVLVIHNEWGPAVIRRLGYKRKVEWQ